MSTRAALLAVAVIVVNVAGVGVALDRAGGEATVAAGPVLGAADRYVPAEVPGTGRPADFLPGAPRGDGTVFAPFVAGADGVKEFSLTAAPLEWEVAPGQKKSGLAFNGSIPGPTIRVNQGDPIRIIVQNNLAEETVVHWHGMILPHSQDGVPPFTQHPIAPGGSFTYEFTAEAPGTHWYHSHIDGDQVGKGLHGSLEVVPRTGEYPVDRDYRLFVGDTNLGLVINGKTFPHTAPLKTKVGERVRIRLTATGEMQHPFHLHGQPFQVVAQDGFPLAQPQWMDTLLIATAQTFDIIAPALAPGQWVFHCHIFSHMHKEAGGHEMSGLVTVFDVAPADSPAATPPLPPPGVQLPPAAPVTPTVPGAPAPPPGSPAPPSAPVLPPGEEPAPH
jgi:FtsP/CotA-like multicopper oxidase with cupredoxin domain